MEFVSLRSGSATEACATKVLFSVMLVSVKVRAGESLTGITVILIVSVSVYSVADWPGSGLARSSSP